MEPYAILEKIQRSLECRNFPDLNFKPKQVKCLESIVRGQDVIGVFPTGYGKSLIFQLLPDVMRNKDEKSSIVIVITCLNAIMEDQVNFLKKVGMTCYILRDLNFEENAVQTLFEDICLSDKTEDVLPSFVLDGHCDFLFCHPEAILSERGRTLMKTKIYQKNVKACVIDEAHCLDTWGKEFRKEFENLGAMRAFFREVPFIALTATATEKTLAKIKHILGMKTPTIISVNPNRKNVYMCKEKRKVGEEGIENIILPLAKELKSLKKSFPQTIIYCGLRFCGYIYKLIKNVLKEHMYVENITNPSNCLIVQFHAPQTKSMKNEILLEVAKEVSNIRVIIATSALGMGVHAPYIEQIFHISPPSTIEDYMQQFGRAGRRGQEALARLYYTGHDISSRRLKQNKVDEHMVNFCTTTQCLRKVLMIHFGYHYQPQDQCCSNCDSSLLKEPKKEELIKYREVSDESLKKLSDELDNILADHDQATHDAAMEFYNIVDTTFTTDYIIYVISLHNCDTHSALYFLLKLF
ncbi:ATP-dependent DNA helicase RecQ-like [Hydractinia symbiolongicarpus]|uniref:ATP-dependent DNA helicase RecQ-like n=1 Tax=Hydractinia symbiolongicarpus TaxID=13093 RepID=UPI00254B13FC|nr:ATP-dependent DNA helicase RecQ-like [Hydractinia symbiolongicarpus]